MNYFRTRMPRRYGAVLSLFIAWACLGPRNAAADNPHIVTVMTRNMDAILAGDFNANAEPGPDHTGTVQAILSAGFADAWTGSVRYSFQPRGEVAHCGASVARASRLAHSRLRFSAFCAGPGADAGRTEPRPDGLRTRQ